MHPAGLTCRVGGRPDGCKDPTCPLWRGIKTHTNSHPDMKETYGWLKAANLPAATEGLVVAAQDQARRTRYYEQGRRVIGARGG